MDASERELIRKALQRGREALLKASREGAIRPLSEVFTDDRGVLPVAGTEFQRMVWGALMCIPLGALATYGDVAKAIGRPQSVRAVANAIAANKVAVVIPCHRVVPASGGTGNYRWGADRKSELIISEIQSTDHSAIPTS